MTVVSFFEFTAVATIPLFVTVIGRLDQVVARPDVSAVMAFLGIETGRGLIMVMGLCIVALFLLKGVLTTVVLRRQVRMAAGISADTTRTLFSAYVRAPYFYILGRNTAKLQNIATGETQRMVQTFLEPFLNFVQNAMLMLALLLIVLVYDPLIGLGIAVFAGTGGYLFMRSNRARLLRAGKEMSLQNIVLIQKINEALGGFKHVKLRGLEAEIFGEADVHIHKRAEAYSTMRFVQQLPKPLFETVGLSLLIMVILIMLSTGRPIESVLPSLVMLGTVSVRILPAMFGMTSTLSSMRANTPAVTNILREMEALHLSRFVPAEETEQPATATIPMGDIVLEDVSVRYPGTERDTLKAVSLDIPAGSSVAFVGPTGSGKSTTVDTILGFIEITGGDIRVGGQSILGDHMRAWQSKIGYIPQTIYLSDMSIRRNVALGVPADKIDDEAVWSALEDAQLAGYVREMPEGLDTIVGERGVKLSGGQRQRIGIARALYNNPELLVLDEATSALDNETETRVIAAIESAKRGRTLIMIAHRLSTVRNCDRIFFLRDGELISTGTYDELMGHSPEFKRMASVG